MENNNKKLIVVILVIIVIGLISFGIYSKIDFFGNAFGSTFKASFGNKKVMEESMKKMIEQNKPISIDNLKIMVNSVIKKQNDCDATFINKDGSCDVEETDSGDYYLVIDVSITNNSKKDFNLNSSSIKLATKDGEVAKLKSSSSYIKSDLLNEVLAGEKLKGQVVFNVVDSEEYYLYLEDFFNHFDSKAKIKISKSDIVGE